MESLGQEQRWELQMSAVAGSGAWDEGLQTQAPAVGPG